MEGGHLTIGSLWGELLRQFRNQNPPRATVLMKEVIRKPIPTSTNGKPMMKVRITKVAFPMYFFPQREHFAENKVNPFPQSKHIITHFSPSRTEDYRSGWAQVNSIRFLFRAISVARRDEAAGPAVVGKDEEFTTKDAK